MPRRASGRRRSSRRRTPRRRRGQFYVEEFTFSIAVGATQSLTQQLLANKPSRSSWRPVFIQVQCGAAYSPPTANSTTPGYGSYVPSAVQIVFTEQARAIATSGIRNLGPQPSRVTSRYPRSADWLSWDLAQDYQFGYIEAVCTGNPGASAYLRGSVRVGVALAREVITPTCPTFHLTATDPTSTQWYCDHYASWADEVEATYPSVPVTRTGPSPGCSTWHTCFRHDSTPGRVDAINRVSREVSEDTDSVIIDLSFLDE